MSSTLQLKLVEPEFPEFSQDELKGFRESFQTFDLDHNGVLEVFELHQMFEKSGETKTNAELLQLIKEADTSSRGGIDYKDYLSVMLKEKKGLLKCGSSMSSLVISLARVVAKQHDQSKDTGKQAAAVRCASR
eukprot:TRINITY_DN10108_c0_g1_i1.p1 TRINITY_DN10108_c0_g1~~TRINITY_DN10108_c0_g1_i1.p1  ORF type:complete len:153 (+),score=46.93 TRINITY_DN10108_c0_g1_i1:61-459(+)